MSCVRFLPARFSAGAASGAGRAAAQDMTSGCASSLRAGPFGAAHSGLPHFEMPQQPGNALHLCCHSSAPVICALRGTPQDLRAAFPQEPGVSYCVRPFRRGALLWGSWGSSTAGRLIRKSYPSISGRTPVLSAGTVMMSPAWKMGCRTGALGQAAAGQGGTADRPLRSACLPPHHGGSRMRARALEGVPAVHQEGSALFPGSLRAAGSGCCLVLPDSKSAPLLERRGDEAAAPYDDEGACEASWQVRRIGYRPETKELWELPRAPFQILKCHSMRSSAPASGHSCCGACACTPFCGRGALPRPFRRLCRCCSALPQSPGTQLPRTVLPGHFPYHAAPCGNGSALAGRRLPESRQGFRLRGGRQHGLLSGYQSRSGG